MSVIGESYLVGLVGEGVLPSLTPLLHEAEADEHGLRYLYRPIDLLAFDRDPEELDVRLERLLRSATELGFNALNVTHPCKQGVLAHLDTVTPAAAALGAVNTVLLDGGRRIGHNTDVSGFASALRDGLPAADLGAVVLLGAGGAGAAVAWALLAAGGSQLTIVDPDADRAAALAVSLSAHHPTASIAAAAPSTLPDAIAGATGVVNASFVGMHTHPGAPIDPRLLPRSAWVADIVYRPVETEFVTAARASGCRTLDGGGMAVAQAADAFRLITGIEPDRERMRRHFAELIREGR